ncbi:uncharacterized protein LOC125177531 [Hyalella azteca]|uniref:Uncharacterized protein LOC125177531 n=1 Tax=Hyalella azteca TaxID=294128 RepID=A0A8B7NY09_HYAAZ|nr:uncharacterized protein LOC125177531 [Hyalella azteca]
MKELIPLHHAAEEYFEKSFQLLNHQWPRLRSVRMGMLHSSRDSLPTSLVLVDEDKVIGHIKIKHLACRHRALWIESVVIDKALRGKGFGKILMLETEKYAREMGFQIAYLSTYDQQGFYSRLGYQECEKVCVFDKPVDNWLPDTSFLKNKIWNVKSSRDDSNNFNNNKTAEVSADKRSNCYQPPCKNENNTTLNGDDRSTNNGYIHEVLSATEENLILESSKNVVTNGHNSEGENQTSSNATRIPVAPPLPQPKRMSNNFPKKSSSCPPVSHKKFMKPDVSISPIKEGVAVPAPPPPRTDSPANNFLLISGLLSSDSQGFRFITSIGFLS